MRATSLPISRAVINPYKQGFINKSFVEAEFLNITLNLIKINNLLNLTIKFTTPSETTMLTGKGKNLQTIT